MSTFYSVAGSAYPGAFWPGDTLTAGGGDSFALFVGNVICTYSQYIDLNTMKTLVANPGNTYDIILASGYPGPPSTVPDDGRWITQ